MLSAFDAAHSIPPTDHCVSLILYRYCVALSLLCNIFEVGLYQLLCASNYVFLIIMTPPLRAASAEILYMVAGKKVFVLSATRGYLRGVFAEPIPIPVFS